MKWFKANEKIPDNLDNKHFRKSGTNIPVPYRAISLYDSFEKNFIRFWINPFDIKIISIKELEWLDEETETHDASNVDSNEVVSKEEYDRALAEIGRLQIELDKCIENVDKVYGH